MFTVTDMYLASFLMARGHAVRVIKSPGALPGQTRCQFVFPPAAEPEAWTFENDQPISVAGYVDALKRLKALMARAPLTTDGAR
jgi:hypothetical protein